MRYNLYSISEPDKLVESKQRREIFLKLQKYAFLKQNNFMRIDELPYHSSLFYKLNFVSRRQFFINIGKYPSKMQKVRNDPFFGNKIFKRRALFSASCKWRDAQRAMRDRQFIGYTLGPLERNVRGRLFYSEGGVKFCLDR